MAAPLPELTVADCPAGAGAAGCCEGCEQAAELANRAGIAHSFPMPARRPFSGSEYINEIHALSGN
jgi:hypothetical protein